MADTALDIVNMMIDAMAGSPQPKQETLVPALLELAGYIADISGDIGEAVQSWIEEHPDAISESYIEGMFDSLTTSDIEEMIGE